VTNAAEPSIRSGLGSTAKSQVINPLEAPLQRRLSHDPLLLLHGTWANCREPTAVDRQAGSTAVLRVDRRLSYDYCGPSDDKITNATIKNTAKFVSHRVADSRLLKARFAGYAAP
jgi:hypothetical protein